MHHALVSYKLHSWFYFLIGHSSHIASGLSSRVATPAGLRTLDTDTDTRHSGEVVSMGKMMWK